MLNQEAIDRKDKVLYYHKANCDFTVNNKSYLRDQIVYIGSGHSRRVKTKVNRSKYHLSVWTKLDFEIVLSGLTSKEAEKYEQRMIHKYWESNLLNKKKNIDVKKNYIYSELNKIFYLDSDFNLLWLEDRYGGTNMRSLLIKKGTLAGYLSRNYRIVNVSRINYQVHRIVWCLYNKSDIDHVSVVDHIDRNPLNNHPLNLRVCSHYENQINSLRKNKSTGIQYISYCNVKKYFQVQLSRKNEMYETLRTRKEFRILPFVRKGLSFDEAYSLQLKAAQDYLASIIDSTATLFDTRNSIPSVLL